MSKSGVAGMDVGISQHLTNIAGLPDGMASLVRYFEKFGVTPQGRQLVLKTFAAPARRVGGGRYNVTLTYASRKMDRQIQAESRTVEAPFVRMCEEDPGVLFYLCQPGPVYVRQRDAKGRVSRRPRTFDYLVLHVGENADECGFWLVECKRAEALEKEAAKPSANFVRDGSRWRFPAAEEAAQQMGLRFRVFSPDEGDSTWCMNMEFLSDYVDVPCPDDERAEALLGWLRQAQTLRIQQALSVPGMGSEVVWWLIANNFVWADWSQELMSDVDTSSIHASQPLMLASRHLREPLAGAATSDKVAAVRVEPGCPLRWDGKPFVILNRGDKEVTLQHVGDDGKGGGTLVPIPVDQFWRLLKSGSIRGDEDSVAARISAAREALVREATNKAREEANWRWEVLLECRETGIVPVGVSKGSVDRFERWAREGLRKYGGEYFGLIRQRGRRRGTPDLDGERQALVEKVVENYKGSEGGAGLSVIYRELRDDCKERGIDPPPSYSTVRRRVQERPVWDMVLGREGWRSAYGVKGPARRMEDVPAAPIRAFQTAHLDHTPMDVKVVSRYTGVVLESKVNITFMVDAYCGMPLGMYVSFDPPSKVAVCEVLLDCIARHGGLPENIAVDRGREFGSVDWEAALVKLGVNKVGRPASSPRVGSPIECHFGISDEQFIHALPGSTALWKPGRKTTQSHAPARFAALTFAQLQEGCQRWFFEVFPELPHGELGATRREAFEHSLERSGKRDSRYIPLDASTRILLSLSVPGDSRKVRPVQGIRVKWLDYWHDDFSYGDVMGTRVEVRIDPLDASVVYARVRGKWVTCGVNNGRVYIQGRSWKLVDLAIKETREQRRTGAKKKWVNAERVAELIREIAGQDSPAGRQAQLDRESRGGAALESAAKGRPNLQLVKNQPTKSKWLDGATQAEANSVPDDDRSPAVEPCDVIR